MTPRLQRAFVNFSRLIHSSNLSYEKEEELSFLFNELLDLVSSSSSNTDGTIAPFMSIEDEDTVISMMVIH